MVHDPHQWMRGKGRNRKVCCRNFLARCMQSQLPRGADVESSDFIQRMQMVQSLGYLRGIHITGLIDTHMLFGSKQIGKFANAQFAQPGTPKSQIALFVTPKSHNLRNWHAKIHNLHNLDPVSMFI